MDDDGLKIGGTKGSAATRNWRRSIRSQPRGLNKVLGYELDDSECWVLRDEAMKLRDLPMVAARAGKRRRKRDSSRHRCRPRPHRRRYQHRVPHSTYESMPAHSDLRGELCSLKNCSTGITLCSRRQACSREGMELACKCLSSGMWRSGGEMGAALVVTVSEKVV
jgi:hypothetical protein